MKHPHRTPQQLLLPKHATDNINSGTANLENKTATNENNKPFSYFYKGQSYAGFYDRNTKTFVATQNNRIINAYKARSKYVSGLKHKKKGK